jgi:hypothetical protein
MDGMWKNLRAGNGDWTILRPDGRYIDRDVKAGWAKWQALPASEKKPGAYEVVKNEGTPKGAPPQPPPGTLIVRATQRNLKRTPKGDLVRLTKESTDKWCRQHLWGVKLNDSFNDVMWLQEDEWKSLVPAEAKKGDRLELPEKVKKRLVLWHLTNRTFCVGISWEEKDLRSEHLSLVVEEVAPVLKLRLEGSVLLKMDGTAEDKKIFWGRTEHGYDAKLLGFLEYDREREKFTRFDIVSIGDYWGGDCEGGRCNVGRLPLGISFELATGATLKDQVLPVGGVVLNTYLKLGSQFAK